VIAFQVAFLAVQVVRQAPEARRCTTCTTCTTEITVPTSIRLFRVFVAKQRLSLTQVFRGPPLVLTDHEFPNLLITEQAIDE
jgi:hypothetical protein